MNVKRRNDYILIGVLLLISFLLAVYYWLGVASDGERIIVQIDGQQVAAYDLKEEQEIELNQGSNILEIRDHTAKMKSANCPDKICVHQKEISRKGESIVCLPNKIVVYVSDGAESEFDAIVQ